jgi:hypothetical protein
VSKKHINQSSVHYSNVVDALNDKYRNWEAGTHYLWSTDDGFPEHDKWPEGEELEEVLIKMCDEEYGEIINNLYGAYAKVHNRNFAPKEEVEVGRLNGGSEDNLIITYYLAAGQLVNENGKGVRVYHTKHELYASCHEYEKRFQNKLGAIKELDELLKKKGLER